MRAEKACNPCRKRKVRCDVMRGYHTTSDGQVACSNCITDQIKCIVDKGRRRESRKSTKSYTTALATINNEPMDEAQKWINGLADNINPTDLEQDESLTLAICPTDSIWTTVTTPPNLLAPVANYDLPKYITPLPPQITSLDIEYLFDKGSLSIPEVPLRNALLQSYLEFIYPTMPLLEHYEVLKIIENQTGDDGQLSLLLVQAIMFAGTAYVEIELLNVAGYSTRNIARNAFFEKARALYDLDCEMDHIALIQSTLLMTYWYEYPDNQKDAWHWVGIAVSLAYRAGLHRDPEDLSLDPSKKKLRKRIWWSCFMRDRLVALGMGKPTRIKDEDYDVPMLTERDFLIVPISNRITIIDKNCSIARDVKAQGHLAKLCIAKAKLCIFTGQILRTQYSALGKEHAVHRQDLNTLPNITLFPRLHLKDEYRGLDEKLSHWITKLPDCGTCSSPETSPDGSDAAIFLQRATLQMIYFATLSALHTPHTLSFATPSQYGKHKEVRDLSRKKIREALINFAHIYQDLQCRGFENYLHTTGVTILLPATTIHLLHINSDDHEVRQSAINGLKQCVLLFDALRGRQTSTDFATQLVEFVIHIADIDIDI